jgi:mannose-6-phosphate isomerase-like protein (cupin superfamily)
MKNIRIIETGLDVSAIKAQLEQYPEDWGHQKKLDGIVMQDPERYHTMSDVLQLVIGQVEYIGQYVGDSEICLGTPALKKHTVIVDFLRHYFSGRIRRCAFLTLPVGGTVGSHIDHGSYYLNKDRYHLSIQGRYRYTVGDESVEVEPGTLFWFNNKLEHRAENIANEVRISFVFDVLHHPENL